MDINLTDNYKTLLQLFLLLISPWILILAGIILGIENAWFFLLAISWFGCGVIFMSLFS
ncbi:MAG: hypothetical protein R6V50_05240 [Thermoplasmatota archaeon]